MVCDTFITFECNTIITHSHHFYTMHVQQYVFLRRVSFSHINIVSQMQTEPIKIMYVLRGEIKSHLICFIRFIAYLSGIYFICDTFIERKHVQSLTRIRSKGMLWYDISTNNWCIKISVVKVKIKHDFLLSLLLFFKL